MRILFVCTGNTCRSPMAAAYFKNLCQKRGRFDIHVDSAGTHAGVGAPASEGALEAMKSLHIDLSSHRSKPLDRLLAGEAELIVAMTRSHRLSIGAIDHHALAKTRLLLEFAESDGEIADPVGGDCEAYKDCFQDMRSALENLFLEIDAVIAGLKSRKSKT